MENKEYSKNLISFNGSLFDIINQEDNKSISELLSGSLVTTFEDLVEVLAPPKHDGTTNGLFCEMLANKMKYMAEHKFESYEEEKQWMANYLREHWYVDCER